MGEIWGVLAAVLSSAIGGTSIGATRFLVGAIDPLAIGAFRFGIGVLLRLPLEVRDLFREWLMANYPDRYRHVFTLIRDMRGGRDYDSQWGTRMKGTGPMAWMIGRRFEIACEKLGLNKRRTKLTTDHFAKPKRNGQQLSLF